MQRDRSECIMVVVTLIELLLKAIYGRNAGNPGRTIQWPYVVMRWQHPPVPQNGWLWNLTIFFIHVFLTSQTTQQPQYRSSSSIDLGMRHTSKSRHRVQFPDRQTVRRDYFMHCKMNTRRCFPAPPVLSTNSVDMDVHTTNYVYLTYSSFCCSVSFRKRRSCA